MRLRGRARRLLRHSVTELCSSRSLSNDRDTLKYRSSVTSMATWCTCMNVTALYSAGIRRLSAVELTSLSTH